MLLIGIITWIMSAVRLEKPVKGARCDARIPTPAAELSATCAATPMPYYENPCPYFYYLFSLFVSFMTQYLQYKARASRGRSDIGRKN